MIRALRVGTVGPRYWGARRGQLFALLPEPVDSDACLATAGFTAFEDSDGEWKLDFQRLVSNIVTTLERMFGQPSVVAPRRPQPTTWQTRLAQAIGLAQPRDQVNPDNLAPGPALTSAATNDSYLEFAAVEFNRLSGQPLALAFCSDGHPIIWIWLDESVAASGSELLDAVASDWPHSELDIAWQTLLPEKPRLSIELARARLHRGDSASWTDGSRSLGFQAGLGVQPHEVYLPSESAWAAAAPAWAATLRSTIVRDFEQMGVRVVEHPRASVSDGHPEADR